MVKKPPPRSSEPPPQPATSTRPPVAQPALKLATHDELVAHLPEIFQRLNANPDIARLLFINPIFALEDLNVELSDDLEDHLKRTLGFPKGRVTQIIDMRRKLRAALDDAAGSGPRIASPQTPKERADLIFDRLGVEPGPDRPTALTVEALRSYASAHPIVAMMYQLGVLERGAIVFNTRGAYEEYKNGRSHHEWLKQLRFRPPR